MKIDQLSLKIKGNGIQTTDVTMQNWTDIRAPHQAINFDNHLGQNLSPNSNIVGSARKNLNSRDIKLMI